MFLLRSFADDGSVLVGNRAVGDDLIPLEGLIDQVVVSIGIEHVNALEDPSATDNPKGVSYIGVETEDWWTAFREELSRSAAIVLLVGKSGQLGPNFMKEVKEIVTQGLQHRVVVVSQPHIGLAEQTKRVLLALDWHLPESQPLVASIDGQNRLVVFPSFGEKDDYLADAYEVGLCEGLLDVAEGAEPLDPGLVDHLACLQARWAAQLGDRGRDRR